MYYSNEAEVKIRYHMWRPCKNFYFYELLYICTSYLIFSLFFGILFLADITHLITDQSLESKNKAIFVCNLTFSYSISRIQTSTVSKPTPTPAARTNVSSSRPKAPLLGRKMVSGMSTTKFSRLFLSNFLLYVLKNSKLLHDNFSSKCSNVPKIIVDTR